MKLITIASVKTTEYLFSLHIVTTNNKGRLQPARGQFTLTTNKGDMNVTLAVDILETPDGLNVDDIQWQKQSNVSSHFKLLENQGDTLLFPNVTKEDEGVYATYWRGHRQDFRFSLIRLIVRGM